MKLSDWQTEKPKLVGVYETTFQVGIPFYQYWNGDFWGITCGSVERAIDRKDKISSFQFTGKWRGLVDE